MKIIFRRKVIVAFCLLISPLLCNAQRKSSNLYEVAIRKVKQDIYVAYRLEPLRYFVEGNVTIIINEADVVVVDAGGSPLAARHIIREIKKLTPKPVRYLINTHDHVDHTLGNQEFLRTYSGVEIISHAKTRENLDTAGRKYVADTIKDFATKEARAEELFKRLRDQNLPGNDHVIAYWQ